VVQGFKGGSVMSVPYAALALCVSVCMEPRKGCEKYRKAASLMSDFGGDNHGHGNAALEPAGPLFNQPILCITFAEEHSHPHK